MAEEYLRHMNRHPHNGFIKFGRSQCWPLIAVMCGHATCESSHLQGKGYLEVSWKKQVRESIRVIVLGYISETKTVLLLDQD